MADRGLTVKQQAFVNLYIETGNATEAYKRAGYKIDGWSEGMINTEASKTLRKPLVKAEIDKRLEVKDKSAIASQDEILAILTNIARGVEMESIPLGVGMGAQELVENKPKLSDRIRAADLLGKRYGIWTEKVEHSGSVVQIVDDVR